ncbi:hypothetical protein BT96DRAFT_815034, partial [Gymnopus androsaceus JB14]
GCCVPNHVIYDSNCILSKYVCNHQNKELRKFFAKIGLAVDVFHFKCKHKEGDKWCSEHCNPITFPELRYEENGKMKWFFNISIAEQVNTWFGKYNSICQEIGGLFFDFFLNKMIRLHNYNTKQKLE